MTGGRRLDQLEGSEVLAGFVSDVAAATGAFKFAASFGVSSANADNSDAFDALLATLQRGEIVVLPRGQLRVSRTVAWPQGVRVIGGQHAGANLTATDFLGITPGMTVMTTDSFTLLESFGIDGNHSAAIGLYAPTSNRISISRVEVKRFTQYGLVLDNTQNSLLIDCMARDSLVCYAVINGATLNHFIQCNSDQFNDVYGASGRSLLMGSVTDVRFGSPTTANRHNRFVGGIWERGTGTQIEITGAQETTQFVGMNIQSNATNAATVSCAGTVVFRDCFFALSGSSSARAVSCTAGVVLVDNPSASGTGGTHRTALFTASSAGIIRWANYDAEAPMLSYSGTAFDGTGHGWTVSGGASISHNATKRRLEMTSASNSQEVRPPLPNASGVSFGQWRVIRVRFGIQNITGGTTVRLQSSLSIAPFRRSHGDFAAGYHEVYIELQGDEFNVNLAASSAVSTTAEIVYFDVKVVSAL